MTVGLILVDKRNTLDRMNPLVQEMYIWPIALISERSIVFGIFTMRRSMKFAASLLNRPLMCFGLKIDLR